MTITDVYETYQESAGWTHAGEVGSGKATAERTFQVTHSGDERPAAILADPRIPKIGSAHPWNFYWRCRGSKADRKGPILTEVVSVYDTKSWEDGDDPDNPANPLDAPPKVRVFTINVEEEIDEDIDGNQIATANAEPINGVTMPIADMGIEVSRNLPTFNLTAIDDYMNTVNSAPFLGFETGRVKLVDIEATNIVEDDFAYWPATVVFQVRKPIRTTAAKTWWKRVRHEGRKVRIVGIVDRIEIAKDANQFQVSTPVLLYPNGEEITNVADTKEAWLEWEIMESIDFNTLNLL